MQNNFEKVNKTMITKLNMFFMHKLNDDIVEAVVEDLGGFSEQTLQKAFVEIRRKCKRLPSLAEIISICEEMAEQEPRPQRQKEDKKGFTIWGCGKAEEIHPTQTRQILTSSAGKYALEKGVGFSLVVEYEKTGRMDFDFNFVDYQYSKWLEAAAKVADVKDPAFSHAVTQIYNTIQEREKKLNTMFGAA